MKKFLFSLMTMILTSSVLFGCVSNKEPSLTNEAPKIIGVQNEVRINLGESFNPLQGVSASDTEDGNLTNNITIASVPVLVLKDNVLTPQEPGEYYITYTVKDSKGNETNEFTTLIVTKAFNTKTVYKDYVFAQAGEVDLAGWALHVDDSASATLAAKQGKLVIDVANAGDSDWKVKLAKAEVVAEANAEYELKITMNASKAAKFTFVVNDAAKGWSPLVGQWGVDIDTTTKTFSYKYTSETNLEAVEYLLQVGGNEGSFSINIDKIELFTSTGSETAVVLVSDNFASISALDNWGIAKSENAIAENTLVDGALVHTISKYDTENQPWNINLFYKTGLNLVKDQKYKFEADVTVNSEQFYELCFEDVKLDWQVRAGFKNGNLTGTMHLEHTFYAGMDIEGLYIKLAVGKGSSSTNEIKIDNISFAKLEGDKVTTSEATTFMVKNEEALWDTYNDNGGVGALYVENSKLYYNITQFGSTDWYNKMFIKKLNLEADALYTVEFKAKADKNIKGFFAFNVYGKWDPRITTEFELSTQEQTYTFTTTQPLVIAMDFEILFQFGGYTQNQSPALLEFSSITVYKHS